MRLRLGGVLVLLAVGVAGCGGDGGVRIPVSRGPSDQARARAIVLQASDLPADWTSRPRMTDDDGSGDAFRICLGLLPKVSPSADSPNFSSPASMTVGSSVTVAANAQVIDKVFAAFEDPKALACVVQRFDAQAKGQTEATFGPGKAERLDLGELGDGVSAVRVTSRATTQGQQVAFYLDTVVVKKGRVGITMSFANAPDPFPTTLATDLVRKLLART